MLKLLRFTTGLAAILMLFIIVSPSYAGLDDKSLVLYLSFDEGKGGTAKDSSAHGHDGELMKSPTWVDGQFGGKALEFDGEKGQYVMVPINDTLQLREQFSLAFWTKRGKAQIRDWNYMVSAGSLVWACIFKNGDQKTYFWSKAPNWAQKGVSNSAQPDDWVHISVTHDIDSAVTIYYDGKKAGGGAKPPGTIEIDGSIMVGARHPGEEFYTGVIDEVHLFDRILTEAEINTIKDGEFAPVEPAEKLATTWGVIKTERR
ncbi:MAG: LamG domain-containing protein [Candidatus Poribacteria bacterium]|nr:LamG domain-containing protein [Candidatus Poribacteria bacterium]